MFLNMKKKAIALAETITEMIGLLPNLSDTHIAVTACLAASKAIVGIITTDEEVELTKSKIQIERITIRLNAMLDNKVIINAETIQLLLKQTNELINILKEEIKPKLNIVFFPYKASMWDSLATVYEAAIKDNDCVVHVVPVPYYQLTQNEAIPTYEGDLFPKDVQITHYNQYNLEDQRPDIVYVHNIYDQHNTLTQLHEQYFTSNLKKYTDMLVYIPYHIPSFHIPKQGEMNISYNFVSMVNVDKVILASEFLREAALKENIPEEKLLVLGTPKFDSLHNALSEKKLDYPLEWKQKIEGKTVYVINTGCMFFASEPFEAFERLIEFFSIPRITENSVIIWRPHPLTKISIMKYNPYFNSYYNKLTEKYIKGEDPLYENILLDETSDYIPVLKLADVLISTDGSLLRSYLLTEKKVLYWDEKAAIDSLLPADVFYYAYNRKEPWYDLVKKFSRGHDPQAGNRKGIAAKVYANTDGTAGLKIHEAIKIHLLK